MINTSKILLIAAVVALSGANAFADVVFEGYYRVEKAGQHDGFVIVREEHDPQAGTWTISYLLETFKKDGRVNQVHAVLKQNEKFTPISADYAEWGDGIRFESVMTEFKGKSFKWHVDSGGLSRDRVGDFEKNQFFLSSINRVLPLANAKTGKTYPYNAIRDDASPVKYQMKILDESQIAGRKVFQVVDENPWRREEYWMTQDGQVLFNRLPQFDITVALVPNLSQAVGTKNYDKMAIENFFGKVPCGCKNLLNEKNIELPLHIFDPRLALEKPAAVGRGPASVSAVTTAIGRRPASVPAATRTPSH